MIVYLMSPKEKNSIHGENKNNRIYNKKNPPTIEKKPPSDRPGHHGRVFGGNK